MGCTNQNTYVCSREVDYPARLTEDLRRFTGAEALRISNESGTSERSSKESEIRGSVGVVVSISGMLFSQDRREDGVGEGSSERTRRIDCVLPLKDKLRSYRAHVEN
jgi:hypothetical protein